MPVGGGSIIWAGVQHVLNTWHRVTASMTAFLKSSLKSKAKCSCELLITDGNRDFIYVGLK